MSYDRDDGKQMVEVTGELRDNREKSWAVFFGEVEVDRNDKEREVWVFLPKSQCEQGDNKNTWLVPEWLAQEKGLI